MNDEALHARHGCSALVITCSDFRFKSAERAFAARQGIVDDYDLIARPGAVRSLVAPRSAAARESLEEEIGLLWALHRFSRVLMVQHLSCGAYADLAKSLNEREAHMAHLLDAGPMMESRFSGVTAEGYVATLVDGALTIERAGLSAEPGNTPAEGPRG